MRFKGKKVLVTGGASGIGYAIAAAFMAEGATVIVTDISTEALDAMDLAGPGELITRRSDAGKVAEIAELAAWLCSEVGALDVLVNNAGFVRMNNPETLPESDYDAQMDVMLKGPVFYVKHLAELLRSSDNGSVVNISSASAILTSNGYCPYAIAKAAIAKFSEECVIQVPGVRHNAVMPGFIDTPILEQAYGAELTERVREAAQKSIPVQRMGTVEDVAEAVLFLASDCASYINGVNLLIDGGMSRLNTAISATAGEVSFNN